MTNDTEIRILLCYLIKSVGPVTREAMEDELLQEELVNYFEFVGALNDLVTQGLAIDGTNGYTITEKGTTVAQTLSEDLPRSVRESAILAVIRIQSWVRTAAQNHPDLEDDHYSVTCTNFQDKDRRHGAFTLQVTMPDAMTAEQVRDHFVACGSEIYNKVLNLLTQPLSDEQRPAGGSTVKLYRHSPAVYDHGSTDSQVTILSSLHTSDKQKTARLFPECNQVKAGAVCQFLFIAEAYLMLWLFAAKVSLAHFDVIGKLGGFALHLDGAGFQHISAVGNIQCHLCVLLHQQHSNALAVNVADDLKDFLDQQRRKTHGGFIQQQDLGLHISARPTASICCSPPERVPAGWLRRSFRRGSRSNTMS